MASVELQQVEVGSFDPQRFDSVLPEEAFGRFMGTVERARAAFEGRVVWNVNSTGAGGGVAEMLRSLLAYAQGSGVDARWVVIQGDQDFFRVTKRIHNHLHGAPGDGGRLDRAEHTTYEQNLAGNAKALGDMVGPRDIVILHDPQTAGLTQRLKEAADVVLWRCHVGLDTPNDVARNAWGFLRDYVKPADALIFSRHGFVWEKLEDANTSIIPPSIDAFSPKNQDLSKEAVRAILAVSGLAPSDGAASPDFVRFDGATDAVASNVAFADGGEPPSGDDQIVTQVSRWDRLKDPVGVIEGFARYVAPHSGAHLIVAGPEVEAVSDDPEGAEVLAEATESWRKLDSSVRARVHLACLPMEDGEENAAIVNALQRRSDVVVQKSLAEGFGLTVAEAMWKARPVVATKIGGIQDQIRSGQSGVLVDDAHDLEAYGKAVLELLEDPQRAEDMGLRAQMRVRDEFLGARHLLQYFELLSQLMTP